MMHGEDDGRAAGSRLPGGLPFGSRWHLEVSADTYVLIEGVRSHSASPHEAPQPLTVEIDLLALGREWDTGVVLTDTEAASLLTALGGSAPAHAPGWIFEPGWLTLCGYPVACQLELTPPVTDALILRLQSVLADREA